MTDERQDTPPETILEAAFRMGRQCEDCAAGRHCRRLAALMDAAWRHGEAAADG